MSYRQQHSSMFYALLIGIDYYLPAVYPRRNCPSLEGCVADITEMEGIFKSIMHLPQERIIKLQSTRGSQGPRETPELWPTYGNIVAAFQTITDMARSGDQIYIHYSGHGCRARTAFPELKGKAGFDEALVPMDIVQPGGQYLRDVEMAHILQTMVEKGAIVTVVLDSCHSGSATRGDQDRVRGLGLVDSIAEPTQSLVASRGTLIETWRDLHGKTARGLALGSGWLPEVKDYVLLAACRATERAYEHRFAGAGTHGVFTYWLLGALKQLTPDMTYKQLHDGLVARVHSEFAFQTPQLQGDGERTVFDIGRRQPLYAVNVMRVDPAGKRLLLNTGLAQAVRQGAQFMVYPPGTTDLEQESARQALVEVSEPGATDSWARIVASFLPDPILPGAQAVLIAPGSTRLCRMVRLIHQDDLPAQIDQRKAHSDVEQAIRRKGSNFVALAEADETADYQVAITPERTYEIQDAAGLPLAHLRPALSLEDQGAAERLTRRLVHLSRYRNVLQLENNAVLSPLAGKLIVELAGMQAVLKLMFENIAFY